MFVPKIAIIASEFNEEIVEKLIKGALSTLEKHDTKATKIEVFRVPGVLEIPVVAKHVAESEHFIGIIALGAVIKGETDHYEHVANQVYSGISGLSLDIGMPMTMGVLTTPTRELALERAGGKAGNVGADAAMALLKTIRTLDKLYKAYPPIQHRFEPDFDDYENDDKL